MTESSDVKIGRLEEKLLGIEKQIAASDATALQHRQWVGERLERLISMGDEWRGVRKMLAAIGAFLLGAGTIGGALVGYFWPHQR